MEKQAEDEISEIYDFGGLGQHNIDCPESLLARSRHLRVNEPFSEVKKVKVYLFSRFLLKKVISFFFYNLYTEHPSIM